MIARAWQGNMAWLLTSNPSLDLQFAHQVHTKTHVRSRKWRLNLISAVALSLRKIDHGFKSHHRHDSPCHLFYLSFILFYTYLHLLYTEKHRSFRSKLNKFAPVIWASINFDVINIHMFRTGSEKRKYMNT